MKYEEKLQEAINTGKGIVLKFREKPNFEMTTEENYYHCPNCNGSTMTLKDKYETPIDIKFMCENGGYSWTEDCKCAECGKMYSQDNGC